MTISLKHLFTSAKSDGSDATLVQPSNWNAEHTITMATAKVLGRATAGTGAVEELSVTGSGSVVLADSPTFTTQMVGPLLIGGTGAGSTLTLESTSGAGTTDAIIFKTGSQVERMRIDTTGRVRMNGSAVDISYGFERHTNASTGVLMHNAFVNWGNSGDFSAIRLFTAPSGTIGSHTAVAVDGGLGAVDYGGSDGAALRIGAGIDAYCDATPTSGFMPARLVFYTAPSGGAATERIRITKDGYMIFGGATGSSVQRTGDAFPIQVCTNGNVSNGVSMAAFSSAGNNPAFNGYLSLSDTRNTVTILNGSGWWMNAFAGYGAGSSTFQLAGYIAIQSDAAFTANTSSPGRISMATTASGAASSTERVRISNSGAVYFIGVGTTASAANAFIDNASSPVNSLLRSTSSLRYKKDVEPVAAAHRDAVLAINPIWYRSKAKADNPNHSFYGMAAEEVAAIDPRLCHWAYLDEDYDEVTITRNNGDKITERVLKEGATLVPDAVMYDRVAILQIAALAAKVDALEKRLAGPHN